MFMTLAIGASQTSLKRRLQNQYITLICWILSAEYVTGLHYVFVAEPLWFVTEWFLLSYGKQDTMVTLP